MEMVHLPFKTPVLFQKETPVLVFIAMSPHVKSSLDPCGTLNMDGAGV